MLCRGNANVTLMFHWGAMRLMSPFERSVFSSTPAGHDVLRGVVSPPRLSLCPRPSKHPCRLPNYKRWFLIFLSGEGEKLLFDQKLAYFWCQPHAPANSPFPLCVQFKPPTVTLKPWGWPWRTPALASARTERWWPQPPCLYRTASGHFPSKLRTRMDRKVRWKFTFTVKERSKQTWVRRTPQPLLKHAFLFHPTFIYLDFFLCVAVQRPSPPETNQKTLAASTNPDLGERSRSIPKGCWNGNVSNGSWICEFYKKRKIDL